MILWGFADLQRSSCSDDYVFGLQKCSSGELLEQEESRGRLAEIRCAREVRLNCPQPGPPMNDRLSIIFDTILCV